MPANSFDIMAFEKFFFACAADPKFTKECVIPEIDRLGAKLDLLDRYLVYPVAIAIMRDRILQLAGRFDWITANRVGAGSRRHLQLGEGAVQLSDGQVIPTQRDVERRRLSVDLEPEPSKGMHLHWDGNNSMFEERDKSAAFGTGTTPPTIDIERIKRVEDWLLEAKPPPFPISRSTTIGQGRRPLHSHTARGVMARAATTSAARTSARSRPRRDRHRPAAARFLYPRAGGQPGDAVCRLPVALHAFSQDARLRQHAARRLVAARALSAQRLGADAARPARARGAAPEEFYRGNDLYDPVRMGFVAERCRRTAAPLLQGRHPRRRQLERRTRRQGLWHRADGGGEERAARIPEDLLMPRRAPRRLTE